MEKNICRIPSDAIKLLGTEPGRKIVYEAPTRQRDNLYRLKEISVHTYELHDELVKRRERIEEKDITARYPSPELLKVIPDVWRIFCDKHLRDYLELDSLDSVRGRRSVSDIFLNELREFGVLFLLTLLATTFTLFQAFQIENLLYLIIICFALSAVISVSITLLKIRSKVR
jgi:hypothetical protein